MENKNPISPHIQIYSWHISSLVSIGHRITGVLNIIIFTDNQKVYNLSYLRSNSKIFKTKKFPKILDSFIYSNIKKNKKLIFNNKKNICLFYATFARKHSRANTFSSLYERDFG